MRRYPRGYWRSVDRGAPVPELGSHGSVRGARGNSRPYRESDRCAVKVTRMTQSGHRSHRRSLPEGRFVGTACCAVAGPKTSSPLPKLVEMVPCHAAGAWTYCVERMTDVQCLGAAIESGAGF